MKIGFIGAGNMGGAVLRGYAPQAEGQGNELFVYVPDEKKRSAIACECGAGAFESSTELTENCDVIVLGVKPDKFEEVLPEVAGGYSSDKLVISMAAGIMIEYIETYLGKDAKIIRIMPNTPAQVGEAMIAVCRNGNVDDNLFEDACRILKAVGKAEEVDEDLIHCVIGVSGSSPAYTFMYIKALIDAAVENGMSPEKAKIFAAQAVLGAARMVLETDVSPEQLKINVCSPGGTTIEAVNYLAANNFEEIVKGGFQAAVEKSKIMSGEKK